MSRLSENIERYEPAVVRRPLAPGEPATLVDVFARVVRENKRPDTLNYKRVAKHVLAFVEQSKFHLVETLAEHIAMLILEDFGVASVHIALSKPGAVRSSRDVGVILDRNRGDLETWRAAAAARAAAGAGKT